MAKRTANAELSVKQDVHTEQHKAPVKPVKKEKLVLIHTSDDDWETFQTTALLPMLFLKRPPRKRWRFLISAVI